MHGIPISALRVGQRGRIGEILLADGMKQRLTDLGLVPGAEILCLHKAPSGTPVAFHAAGAVIALRKTDCVGICLMPDG